MVRRRLLFASWFTPSEKASSNAGVLSFWSISCLNRKFRAFGHLGCPTGPTSGWYPQGNGWYPQGNESSDVPSKDIHPCVGNESLFFETCLCMNVKTFCAVFFGDNDQCPEITQTSQEAENNGHGIIFCQCFLCGDEFIPFVICFLPFPWAFAFHVQSTSCDCLSRVKITGVDAWVMC